MIKKKELIILKIEYFIKGNNIPIIEYQLFHPETNVRLDLNYCKDIKINLYIPVNINEDKLFKYDPTSKYYTDKCNQYTTERGTDITIYDRKKEYNNKNLSLCEKNCQYNGFFKNNKKVACKCQIKTKINLNFEDKNKIKDELLNNFINIKKSINISIIKCYKVLFTKEGLLKNIGNFIILVIILIHNIELFLFFCKGFKSLENQIDEIAKQKKENNSTELNNNNKMNKTRKSQIKVKIKKKKKRRKKNYLKKQIFITDSTTNKDIKQNYSLNLNNDIQKNIFEKNILNKRNSKSINIKTKLFYTDLEINSFDYETALKYDKRTYVQYYFSLLRTKHMLIYAFYPMKDYNSKIIKISLFFFSFSLYYTINALFFTDNTFHIIYEDNGRFNFIFLLPQIIYSTLISSFIITIINYLSLSEKNIIEFKNLKMYKESSNKVDELKKCLIKKFIIYFIISFLLLYFFWYYLSVFCVVYKNTQVYLIKDTIISFSASMILPFGLYLIPGILRIPALNKIKKNKKLLYNISKFIQFF